MAFNPLVSLYIIRWGKKERLLQLDYECFVVTENTLLYYRLCR